MAFTLSQTDLKSLIAMVRAYNVIISDPTAITDKQISGFLTAHAFPRIRGRLITATDSTNKHIFYDNLGNLADPGAQSRADGLVDSVITDSIIKPYVWRIASAMGASWAINNIVGIIESQQKMAHELEKQALDDLKLLVTSPELSLAASQAAQKLDAVPTDGIPKIFMALDVDPSTYNATAASAKTYPAAQENGIARLWIGPYKVEAAITAGDTIPVIMGNIMNAVRTYQAANVPPLAKFNLVVGPNEGPLVTGQQYFEVPGAADPTLVAAQVTTNVGWLSFHVYQYDQTIDSLFCTLELLDKDGNYGISGLLYGVMESELNYQKLSRRGPYSVFIDVKTGQKGTSTGGADVLSGGGISDTFYFEVDNESGVMPTDGRLRYQVANMVANPGAAPLAPQPRYIVIPAGSTAMDVVRLLAEDIDSIGFQIKLLAAPRSPTTITVMGTPIKAPGLQLVPYRPSGYEDRIVFDMLEVPNLLRFGPLPSSMITNGAFDNKPKSLVIPVRFVESQATQLSPLSNITGNVRSTQHMGSDSLKSAFNDIRFFNRPTY
jgi:hypothetical protein